MHGTNPEAPNVKEFIKDAKLDNIERLLKELLETQKAQGETLNDLINITDNIKAIVNSID